MIVQQATHKLPKKVVNLHNSVSFYQMGAVRNRLLLRIKVRLEENANKICTCVRAGGKENPQKALLYLAQA